MVENQARQWQRSAAIKIVKTKAATARTATRIASVTVPVNARENANVVKIRDVVIPILVLILVKSARIRIARMKAVIVRTVMKIARVTVHVNVKVNANVAKVEVVAVAQVKCAQSRKLNVPTRTVRILGALVRVVMKTANATAPVNVVLIVNVKKAPDAVEVALLALIPNKTLKF